MNKDAAKRIPLDTLLSSMGYEPVRRAQGGNDLWYRSPLREEKDPSFHINAARNVWYDHGLGTGGNVVDFVMHYTGHTFTEALRWLEEREGRPAIYPMPRRSASTPEPGPLDVQPLQRMQHRVYLAKRGIDWRLAGRYCQETKEGNYRYIAFPSDSSGYELRNPYLKGARGHKDISTLLFEGDLAIVAVFEGFMDLLSAIQSESLPANCGKAIVMNSAAMRHKAVDALKGATAAHLYLDNDTTGDKLISFFESALPDVRLVDESGRYEGYKDFNEMHQAHQHERKR